MKLNSVEKVSSIATQCFVGVIANSARFVDGMIIAWSTTVIPSLESPDAAYPMTSDQIGWTMSVMGVGGMIGPIVTWLVIDRIGRKMTILISIIPVIISFVIMIIREDYLFLLSGRILVGVGVGLTISSIPIYIGEVVENRIRGAMNVIGVINFTVGNIVGLIVGPCVTLQQLNVICAVAALVAFFATLFIPESPYYCLMKDDIQAARKSLLRLRRQSNVDTELMLMKDYVEQKKRQKSSAFDLVTKQSNRRAFLILLMVATVYLYSGGLAVQTYAYSIYEDSGYDLSLHTLVVIMGVVLMIASFSSFFAVDIFGRRPLLIYSCAGMLLCHMTNGIFYTLKSQDYDISKFTLVPYLALLGYNVFATFGVHNMIYIILSEYFSTNIKAKAAMCFTILMFMLGSASVKLFQLFDDAFGLGPLFFVCCCPIVIFGTILYFMMPETKGCSLQKIENMHGGIREVSTISDINSVKPFPR